MSEYRNAELKNHDVLETSEFNSYSLWTRDLVTSKIICVLNHRERSCKFLYMSTLYNNKGNN